MRISHPGKALATIVAALALGACGSSGIEDILGSPSQRPTNIADEVQGTVRSVDTSGDCVIEIDDARWTDRNNLRNGTDYGNYDSGERLTLYCDDQTVVVHEGQSYRVANLERGDEIAARVDESGNRLLVDRIDVLYDVTSRDDRTTGDGRTTDDDRYGVGGDLRGVVRRVDQENRTILLDDLRVYDRDLDARVDDRVTLYYDTDTDVEFEGQRYRAENLEPGDEVEVRVYEVRGQFIAEAIEVISDVRASRY